MRVTIKLFTTALITLSSYALGYNDSLKFEEPYIKQQYKILEKHEYNRELNTLQHLNQKFNKYVGKKKKSNIFDGKRVALKILVDSNGLMSKHSIEGDSLDSKGYKLLSKFFQSIPQFTPAKIGGKSIDFEYTLDITKEKDTYVIKRRNFLFEYPSYLGSAIHNQLGLIFFHYESSFSLGIHRWYIEINEKGQFKSIITPPRLELDFDKIIRDLPFKVVNPATINGKTMPSIYTYTINVSEGELTLNQRTLAGYEIGN